jgi:hypothetical protein
MTTSIEGKDSNYLINLAWPHFGHKSQIVGSVDR